MAERSISVGSVLVLSLLVLPAEPAAAGEAINRVLRPIPVQEEEKPAAEPRSGRVEPGRAARPTPRALPFPKTKPALSAEPKPTVDAPAAAQAGSGPVPAMQMNDTVIKWLAECAPGFAKAIVPDAPGGFYSCFLPAEPMCGKGYKYEETVDSTPPNHFRYGCEEWEDWHSEDECPPGWTQSGSTLDYYCTSSELRCKWDHQLDPTLSGVTTPYAGARRYYYRCNAK